jgi:Right handed beta helix region
MEQRSGSPKQVAGPARRRRTLLVGAGFVLTLGLGVAGCVAPYAERPVQPEPATVDPDSQLIGCDQAALRITVTVSSHLDAACTYTGGFDISTSGVVLDCRGAHVEDPEGNDRIGIHVKAPSTVALTDVTVRNCFVKGFLNNVRVSREGFKTLAQGSEYEAPFSDITIENSHLYRSRGVGAYVDGYVTGVTLRALDIAEAGSTGVYLEAGSKDNVVEDSTISRNGYKEVIPEGQPFVVNGIEFRYQSTGREGIAVDGSRHNIIRRNWIAGNSAGGIFLYKNCGEFATTQPEQHWVRWYGADDNLIENNVITTGPTGIWVGSRMAENTFPMDCSDPTYVANPSIALDHAADNVIRGNALGFLSYGIRVEDDGTRVEANTFGNGVGPAVAVLVGTKYRTTVLGRPVAGTVLTGNTANLPQTPAPFRWIWDRVSTSESGNTANGEPATLIEGTQPPINPFIFAIRIWVP